MLERDGCLRYTVSSTRPNPDSFAGYGWQCFRPGRVRLCAVYGRLKSVLPRVRSNRPRMVLWIPEVVERSAGLADLQARATCPGWRDCLRHLGTFEKREQLSRLPLDFVFR
jgi:hypothetical protein